MENLKARRNSNIWGAVFAWKRRDFGFPINLMLLLVWVLQFQENEPIFEIAAHFSNFWISGYSADLFWTKNVHEMWEIQSFSSFTNNRLKSSISDLYAFLQCTWYVGWCYWCLQLHDNIDFVLLPNSDTESKVRLMGTQHKVNKLYQTMMLNIKCMFWKYKTNELA